MVKCCPTCGHPIDASEVHAALTPVQRLIYDCVRRAGTAGVDIGGLITHVYYDRDEPDNADMSIRTIIFRSRKRLAPFGLEIRGSGGPGSRYYLRKLEQRT